MRDSTKLARQFILDAANDVRDSNAPPLTAKDINLAVRICRAQQLLEPETFAAAGFRG